ncbi:hypothetical protein [Lacipirellula sp.]|uniref:hypothetical protein n=1 Tax=Lacipirellula sp. TaxID=2691419 RepID=UPI003D14A6C1
MTEPEQLVAAEPARRRSLASVGFSLLWAVNVALFVGAVAWIAYDPVVARHLAYEQDRLATTHSVVLHDLGHASVPAEPVATDSPHARALTIIVVLAAAGVVAVGLALLFGPQRHRRLRSWLAYTALVAAWLGLAVSWRDVAWTGQRYRLGREVAAIEPIAAALRERWPKADGHEIPGLGPYMAYPPAGPRMLMLLHQVRAAGASNSISAIERSDAGGLRFELADGDAGAWLEWHPAGEQPASFTGGLQGSYELVRSSNLGDGWFLARYRVPAAGHTQ